jgi:hypothetical protein
VTRVTLRNRAPLIADRVIARNLRAFGNGLPPHPPLLLPRSGAVTGSYTSRVLSAADETATLLHRRRSLDSVTTDDRFTTITLILS